MTTERRKAAGLGTGRAILVGLILVGLILVGIVGWLLLRESAGDAPAGPLEKSRKAATKDAPPVQLEGRASEQPAPKPAVEKGDAETPPPEEADKTATDLPLRIEGVFQRVGTAVAVDVGRFTLRCVTDRALTHNLKSHDVKGTTDRTGRFDCEVQAPDGAGVQGIWPEDGRWRSHAWYPVGGKVGDLVTLSPEETTQIVVEVTEMIRLEGVVVDPKGQPLKGVRIQYGVPHANASKTWAGYMATTRDDGVFLISGMLAHPEAVLDEQAALGASLVRFQREGFTAQAINVHDVDVADYESWRVVMSRGLSIRGVLIDDAGRTIPGVDVEAVYDDPAKRRWAKTDGNGAFEIAALSEGDLTLRALVLAEDLEASKPITLAASQADVELVAVPIPLPEPGGLVPVMGLRLLDATDALRKEHNLPEHAGVVVVDPGANHLRLGIGTLNAGCGIWMIGKKNVTSVKQMVEQILAAHADAKKARPRWPTVRIVYVYGGTGERSGWSNTQHLTLSADDIAALQRTEAALR